VTESRRTASTDTKDDKLVVPTSVTLHLKSQRKYSTKQKETALHFGWFITRLYLAYVVISLFLLFTSVVV
jgi:hypothetical protein